MRRWRKRKGSTIAGAVLAVIALLGIPPPASSNQAGAVIDQPENDAQKNQPKTDEVSAQDKKPDTENGPLKNTGQHALPQEAGGQQPEAPTPSNADGQKARLTVNPITGLTVSPALNFTPLTGRERWKLYWRSTFFSAGAYFRPVFFALVLDQTTNSPAQWGDGLSGFGLRVASRAGSNIVQGTIRAPLAAALHEDVRYISDQRGGKKRILHAVEYSFLTYNNQGHPTLNVAKLVGYYSSTAISTTWRPGHHPLASYTFENGSEQIGLSVPINILQEFWPDLWGKIARRQGGS